MQQYQLEDEGELADFLEEVMPQPYSLPRPGMLCPVLSYLHLFSHGPGLFRGTHTQLATRSTPCLCGHSQAASLGPGLNGVPFQFLRLLCLPLSPGIENLVPLAHLPARQTPEGEIGVYFSPASGSPFS